MEDYSGTAKNAVLRLPRQNTTQIEIYVYCDISIQILPKMMKKYYHANIKTLYSKIHLFMQTQSQENNAQPLFTTQGTR